MRPNELPNVQWYYPTLQTSEDRRSTRVNVQPPRSWRLRGVDGLVEGGLRPFPGMKVVHETANPGGANHDRTSRLIEVFPVSFLIGDDGYGYGFVYRWRRKTTDNTLADITIDYWNSKTNLWVRNLSVKLGVPLSRREDQVLGRQMSVSVFGRFIYVFVEGQEPCTVSTERDTPWGPVLVLGTGPGKQPLMVDFDQSPGLGAVLDGYIADVRPSVGQIFLTEFEPSLIGTTTAGDMGLGLGTSTAGGLFGQRDEDVRKLEAGDYAFAYQLHNKQNGRKSSLSEVSQVRREDFDLSATVTSPFFPPQYAALQIDYDSAKYDQAYIYRSVKVQDAGGTYIAGILHLDAIVDLVEFHTTNNGVAPYDGDRKQAIYFYELEDKQLAFQMTFGDRILYDDDMPFGGASLWYENTMLVSKVGDSKPSTPDRSRTGDAFRGIGEIRWSSLLEISPELFSPNNRYLPDLTGNQVKVFKTAYPNVVAFSSDRQYLIRKETTVIKVNPIHEGFGTISQFTAESVGSMVYFLTPKGLKTVDANGQLDAVNSVNEVIFEEWGTTLSEVSMAYDAAVSCLIMLNDATDDAYLFWFNTGMVTSLVDLPIRMVCRGSWPINFEWDASDYTTHLGANNAGYKNELVERAFFVEDGFYDPNLSGQLPVDFRHRIFTIDYQRTRKQTHGNIGERQQTLMPHHGNSVFTVSANFSGGNSLLLALTTGQLFPVNSWNMKLYVLKSSNPEMVGKSAWVASITGLNMVVLTAASSPQLYGLQAGDIVGLSPVNFEWVGYPLGVQAEDDQNWGSPGDFFKVRHLGDVMACFVDVQGTESGGSLLVDRYQGVMYRGNEPTPSAIAETRDEAGNLVRSLIESDQRRTAAFGVGGGSTGRPLTGVQGTTMSPGVRVICPNVDFLLTSAMANGRMTGTMMKDRGGSRGS